MNSGWGRRKVVAREGAAIEEENGMNWEVAAGEREGVQSEGKEESGNRGEGKEVSAAVMRNGGGGGGGWTLEGICTERKREEEEVGDGRRWRELGSGAWRGRRWRDEELEERMEARRSGGGGGGLRTVASR